MPDKPPSPRFSTSSFVLVGAIALTIGIFIIDTATTLDIAIAVLYVVVVFVAANFLQRRGVLLVAAGCVALAVLSFLLSHGLSAGPALARCVVSIAAIGATAVLLALGNLAGFILLSRDFSQFLRARLHVRRRVEPEFAQIFRMTHRKGTCSRSRCAHCGTAARRAASRSATRRASPAPT